jgi:phospholipase/carboxylesterase
MRYYHRTMSGTRRRVLASVGTMCPVLFLALASSARLSAGQAPEPAQPPAAAGPLVPGRYELKLDRSRDGTLYVPAGYQAGVAMPLIVWLHGAGGSGQVSANLASMADEFGYLVLAPDSREWTWDAILGQFGPDVEFIRAALDSTLKRCRVDPQRITLAGFSDGASYALSLGISFGDVFRRIYAGSPGVMQPIEVNGKPPIFISHGLQDQTMPIDETSRKFVPRLKALGYDVTYREYEGRHQLPAAILREVFEWLAARDR